MMERSLVVSLVLILSLASQTIRANDDWKKETSWQPFAQRWAASFDKDKNISAIYDLAYPDWTKKIFLGVIGGNGNYRTEISTNIKLAKQNPWTDPLAADKALLDLSRTRSSFLDTGTLPDKWWQTVNWRVKKFSLDSKAPDTFRLSDIDIESEVAKNEGLQKIIIDSQKALNQVEGDNFGDQYLNGFTFELDRSGNYNISWSPPAALIKTSGPRKLSDLNNVKWAFNQSVVVFFVKEGLMELSSLAGPTITGALVGTALDRFFHFYENMLVTQENMLLEVLTDLAKSEPVFPNTNLNPDQQQKVIYSLIFAQASIENKWQLKFLWKDPVKEWKRTLKQTSDFQKANLTWLSSHGSTYTLLNSRFAFTEGKINNSALASLAGRKPNKKGPELAINYSDVQSIYKNRVAEEIPTGFVFGTYFAPYGGAIARAFYKHYVEQPMDNEKSWEGRLLVDLEALTASQSKDYSLEYKILDEQRINPLVDLRSESLKLIDARRKMIGL